MENNNIGMDKKVPGKQQPQSLSKTQQDIIISQVSFASSKTKKR